MHRKIVFISVLLLCFAHIYLWQSILRDDAFIFFTYVKNILAGNGYVFNIGQYVNACTSSLYPLLTAAIAWVIGQQEYIPMIGHWVGGLGLLLLLIATYCMPRQKNGKTDIWLWLIFSLLLFSYPRLRAGVGMETFLVMGLQALTLLFFLIPNLYLSAIFGALTVLARPDSFLFLAVLAVAYLLQQRRLPPIGPLVVFGLVLLPWYLFSYWYFGDIFPNSVSAKIALGDARANALSASPFLRKVPEALNIYSGTALVECLMIAVGVFIAWRKRIVWILLYTVWAVLYILTYSYIIKAPGYAWYYTPLIPSVTVLIALTLSSLLSIKRALWPMRVIVSAVLLVLLYNLFLGFYLGPPRSSGNYVRLENFSQNTSHKYRHYRGIAERLNQISSASDSLAVSEIGILGYFFKGSIVDAYGLIHNDQCAQQNRGKLGWHIECYNPSFVLAANPPRKRERFVSQESFKQNYKLLSTAHQQRARIYTRID